MSLKRSPSLLFFVRSVFVGIEVQREPRGIVVSLFTAVLASLNQAIPLPFKTNHYYAPWGAVLYAVPSQVRGIAHLLLSICAQFRNQARYSHSHY